MLTILLVLFLFVLLGGGYGWRQGYYGPGIYGGSAFLVLLVILAVLWFYPHARVAPLP